MDVKPKINKNNSGKHGKKRKINAFVKVINIKRGIIFNFGFFILRKSYII